MPSARHYNHSPPCRHYNPWPLLPYNAHRSPPTPRLLLGCLSQPFTVLSACHCKSATLTAHHPPPLTSSSSKAGSSSFCYRVASSSVALPRILFKLSNSTCQLDAPDSALLLLSSRCSHPKEKKRGTQPCLGKPVRKLGFWPSSLALKHKLNPEILPPCWKIRICFALSAGCSCCGGEILQIAISRDLPLHCRRLLPLPSSVLQLELWYVDSSSKLESLLIGC
ncbi:hypothetical protein SLEP1_g42427 [Rubroshorea leprosula]|uniref:Uncharacterized protein n=1 Tax=Rubroshorea leprosula TaxID=152421 RepID=A0AAV5L9T2_9ROSI|nr:hypothetical protein SLEP1_g42427 [Rubroshorea leprosula]